MSDSHLYLFYTLLGVDVPSPGEYFGYDPVSHRDEDVTVNTQGFDTLSYHTLSQSQQEFLEKVSRWCSVIPFVECLAVAGSATFGVVGGDIQLIVVTNTGRVWIVKSILNCLIRILQRTLSGSYTHGSIDLVVDRLHTDLRWIRRGVRDVLSVYWLAHLSVIYQQHDTSGVIIHQSNTWIHYLLPKHPIRPVIDLGVGVSSGVLAIRTRTEKVLAGRRGDGIERILYKIGSYLTAHASRISKYCYATGLVGGSDQMSDTLMIQRKMHTKSKKQPVDS